MDIPTPESALERARKNARIIQLKSSIKYIQTSTSITLTRMEDALDIAAAELYFEGFRDGHQAAVDTYNEVKARQEIAEQTNAAEPAVAPTVGQFTPARKEG